MTWECIVCGEPQDGERYMTANARVPACKWCWIQTAAAARVYSDDHQTEGPDGA